MLLLWFICLMVVGYFAIKFLEMIEILCLVGVKIITMESPNPLPTQTVYTPPAPRTPNSVDGVYICVDDNHPTHFIDYKYTNIL